MAEKNCTSKFFNSVEFLLFDEMAMRDSEEVISYKMGPELFWLRVLSLMAHDPHPLNIKAQQNEASDFIQMAVLIASMTCIINKNPGGTSCSFLWVEVHKEKIK